MMTFQLLGWMGTLVVLVSYAIAVRTNSLRVFSQGNVIGASWLCTADAASHAWPAFALSAAFGIIAFHALWTGKNT